MKSGSKELKLTCQRLYTTQVIYGRQSLYHFDQLKLGLKMIDDYIYLDFITD